VAAAQLLLLVAAAAVVVAVHVATASRASCNNGSGETSAQRVGTVITSAEIPPRVRDGLIFSQLRPSHTT
jgi:hypothetical protein